MSQPFIGEILMFAGSYAPAGWALCDGSLLPISAYSALFNLIGTTYGGDGVTTFGLPDLRGRFPVHQGTGGGQTVVLGQLAGAETVTLAPAQLPAHAHQISASLTASSQTPAGSLPAQWDDTQYSTADPTAADLRPAAVGRAGGSQPHENRSPYLAVTFAIALSGLYPSQG
jgi:microcystin-dependent protein